VAEKDSPVTRATGPGRRQPPCPPPPPRVARGDRAQQLPRARRARDDPRVIVPARRLLFRRIVGGFWRHLAARWKAARRAAIGPTRRPVRRVGRPARRAQVRCAAKWQSLPWASGDAGGPPPLRWRRRRHPFLRPTLPPLRQRSCTSPSARSRLWSWPACPVSRRRRARHRPESQGIARTCLESHESRRRQLVDQSHGTSRWSEVAGDFYLIVIYCDFNDYHHFTSRGWWLYSNHYIVRLTS